MDNKTFALNQALKYLKSIKRNEKHLREALQKQGQTHSWLVVPLDRNIERIEKALGINPPHKTS